MARSERWHGLAVGAVAGSDGLAFFRHRCEFKPTAFLKTGSCMSGWIAVSRSGQTVLAVLKFWNDING